MSGGGLAAALGLTRPTSLGTGSSRGGAGGTGGGGGRGKGAEVDLGVEESMRDGEIELQLKKLFKKDAVTKHKGLAGLLEGLPGRSARAREAYLPAWSRLYRGLCVEEDDRRVRSLAHQVTAAWLQASGPRGRKLFRQLLPPLAGPFLCARFDPCASAASSACAAWSSLAPDARLPLLLGRLQDRLLAHAADCLASSLQALTRAQPSLDPFLAEQRHDRLVSTALSSLAFLAALLPPAALQPPLAALLLSGGGPLWRLCSSDRPSLRHSSYSLLAALTRTMPALFEEDPSRLLRPAALALCKGLDDAHGPNHSALWTALLALLRRFPAAISLAPPRQALFTPLLRHLRAVASPALSPPAAYAALPSLLPLLPADLIADQDLLRRLFSALSDALAAASPAHIVLPSLLEAHSRSLLFLLANLSSSSSPSLLLDAALSPLLAAAFSRQLPSMAPQWVIVDAAASTFARALPLLAKLPSGPAPALQSLHSILIDSLRTPSAFASHAVLRFFSTLLSPNSSQLTNTLEQSLSNTLDSPFHCPLEPPLDTTLDLSHVAPDADTLTPALLPLLIELFLCLLAPDRCDSHALRLVSSLVDLFRGRLQPLLAPCHGALLQLLTDPLRVDSSDFSHALCACLLRTILASSDRALLWHQLLELLTTQPRLFSALLAILSELAALSNHNQSDFMHNSNNKSSDDEKKTSLAINLHDWSDPLLDQCLSERLPSLSDPSSSALLSALLRLPGILSPDSLPAAIPALLSRFEEPSFPPVPLMLRLLPIVSDMVFALPTSERTSSLLLLLFRLRLYRDPGQDHDHDLLLSDSSSSSSSDAEEAEADSADVHRFLVTSPVAELARSALAAMQSRIRPLVLPLIPQLCAEISDKLASSTLPPGLIAEEVLFLLQLVQQGDSSTLAVSFESPSVLSSLFPISIVEMDQLAWLPGFFDAAFDGLVAPFQFSSQCCIPCDSPARPETFFRRILFLQRLLTLLDASALFGSATDPSASSAAPSRHLLLLDLLFSYALADHCAPVLSHTALSLLGPSSLEFLREANLFWNVRQQVVEPYLASCDLHLLFHQALDRSLAHGDIWSLILQPLFHRLASISSSISSPSSSSSSSVSPTIPFENLFIDCVVPSLGHSQAAGTLVVELVKAAVAQQSAPTISAELSAWPVLVQAEEQLTARVLDSPLEDLPAHLWTWSIFVRSLDEHGIDTRSLSRSKRLVLDALLREDRLSLCGATVPSAMLAVFSDAPTRMHLVISHKLSTVLDSLAPFLAVPAQPTDARPHADALQFLQMVLQTDAQAEQLGNACAAFCHNAVAQVLVNFLSLPEPSSPSSIRILHLHCLILHAAVLPETSSSSAAPSLSPQEITDALSNHLETLSTALSSACYDRQVMAARLLGCFWSNPMLTQASAGPWSSTQSSPILSVSDSEADLPSEESDQNFFPPQFRTVLAQGRLLMGASPDLNDDASQSSSSHQGHSLSSPHLFGFFLCWKILIELRLSSNEPELRELLTAQVRRASAFDGFLRAVLSCSKLGPSAPFTQAPLCPALAPSPSALAQSRPLEVVEQLCAFLMYGFLRGFPGVARLWWTDLPDRNLQRSVQQLVKKRFSELLRGLEMRSIRSYHGPARSPFTIKASAGDDEVQASYVHDETTLSVLFRLPPEYPLQPIHIETVHKMGIAEAQWRRWILSMVSLLATQDSRLLDTVLLWKASMDKHFEGIESCYICYSVFHATNKSLPKMACRTCSNKFHSACLFRWFTTSHKSVCPLCQSPWFS